MTTPAAVGFGGQPAPASANSRSASPAASAPGSSVTAPVQPPSAGPTPGSSATSAPAAAGTIQTDGRGNLTLNGQRFQFVGVDAYELATLWRVNYGCGSEVDDLDGFFRSLSSNSVVRFWAFQDFTQSKVTGGRDWTALDRVVQAAEGAHQRLIFVLGDQWANCHGEQAKDANFYSGGYRTAAPAGEAESYWDWARDVVTRYKNSPAVGMWEPLNEPQGDCVAIKTPHLRAFFDAVGGLIKSIDRAHLVESGVLGGNQCGFTLGDYGLSQDTPNIDVLSYHDYADPSMVPGGLTMRIQQARQLNKPIIVGEVGYLSDCSTMRGKQPAQFAAGVAGFLPWNWTPAASTCGF